MKPKVLHVSCGGLGNGGVSTVIFSIVEPLHSTVDFDCVVFKKICSREARFLKYGRLFRINCYPVDGKRNYFDLLTRPFKLFWGIYKICKKEKYNVVHCHNDNDEWICLLAAMFAGVKKRIAHSHNTNSTKKIPMIEECYRRINAILISKFATQKVGCSEAACKDFFADNKFRVIHNSVDLNAYSYLKKKPHKGCNFVHVGRFSYQKNQEYVIDTFAVIHEQLPHSRLFLVGYGEDQEKLVNKIEYLKLKNCIKIIPGDSANIPEVYAISDYMIFPSRYEGFGIVLIEAQAMGIKCFVSEAIQKEADLGLLVFLKLKDGSENWAKEILKEISSPKTTDMRFISNKLDRYSDKEVAKTYAELYK